MEKNQENNEFPFDYDIENLLKVTFNDFNMFVTQRYKNHYIDNKYEEFSSDIFINLVKENSVVVDIGANYGYYSLLASTKNKNGKTYAIEPVKENFDVLNKNVSENKFYNIETFNCAISNISEKKEFNVTEASDSAGFYEHPNTKTYEKRAIQAHSLDDLFPGIKVDIIKIDTEGHEIHVLDGMKKIINSNEDLLMLIEFNPKCLVNSGASSEEFLNKIWSFGFSIFLIKEEEKSIFKISKETWVDILGNLEYVNLLCGRGSSREYEILSQVIKVKENYILEKEQEIENKNQEIDWKVQEIQLKSQEIKEKNQEIDLKINELSLIYSSRAWKVIILMRKVLNILIPVGSFRRKIAGYIYRFCKKIIKLILKIRIFILKFINLVKKVWPILKRDGLFIFAKKVIKFIIKYRANYNSFLISKTNIEEIGNKIFNQQQCELSKEEIINNIKNFSKKPLISVIMPVYNTPIKWLTVAIESLRNQYYDNWELCAIDDYSTHDDVRDILKKYSKIDKRIKIHFSKKNGGISTASNISLKIAKGEYIALFDHDDELTKDALYWMVRKLNENLETDFIYSDECKIDDTDKRRLYDFIFKPDWSPEMLLNNMYTGHFTIYKKALVNKLGGFRSKYDFSQDYDLALRVSEVAKDICHVERVLYLWRAIEGSAASGGKEFARASNLAALESAMKRRGFPTQIIRHSWANRAKILFKNNGMVSIIIPSDSPVNIKKIINSIIKKTLHGNFELVIVTNSKIIEELEIQYKGEFKKIRFSPYDKKYNFSDKCNQGARDSNGEILIFMNDDVYPIKSNWIENLIEFLFYDKKIGGVSPKLLWKNNTIQYAGMTTNSNPFIGTFLNGRHKDEDLANMVRNTSILSGACFAIRKEIFFEIAGFDTINTPAGHSDLDLSFKLREKGYRCVYTPYSVLTHVGNHSWHTDKDKADIYVLSKWGKYISNDPYYTKSMRAVIEGYLPEQFGIYSHQEKSLKYSFDALIVAHELSITGAPIVALNIAKAIANAGGYPVIYAYIDGPLRAEFEKINVPVIINYMAMEDEFSFKHFAKNFDIVIANTVVTFPAVSAIQDIVPTIWYIHEAKSIESVFIPSSIDRKPSLLDLLKTTKAIIYTASEYSRNIVLKYSQAVEILNLGFTDQYEGNDIQLCNKIQFSIVGAVTERKAQDVFVDAILRLSSKYRQKAVFNIIGDDKTYEDYTNKLKQKTKNIPEIIWHGLIADQKTKLKLFTDTSVFVIISRDEPTSIVAIEGAMLRRPSIISEDVGAKYLIEDGKTGFVVKTDNIEELKLTIMKIIDHPEILPALGKEARKKYLETSTFEIFKKNLMKIIRDNINFGNFEIESLSNQVGIEIGGPSQIFKKMLPVYKIAKRIDGVNFSEKTLWDSMQPGDNSYKYFDDKNGRQYIMEATNLSEIGDHSYDFLLSSHNLEHIANPMKAVSEWIRVVKPGGIIVIIVPNKKFCFDHKRDDTTFEHIMNDYNGNTTEHDLTHLDEILEKHDLSMDIPAGTKEQFRERSLKNFSNRALHQHVFSKETIEEIFSFLGITLEKSFVDGINIVCIGRVSAYKKIFTKQI